MAKWVGTGELTQQSKQEAQALKLASHSVAKCQAAIQVLYVPVCSYRFWYIKFVIQDFTENI